MKFLFHFSNLRRVTFMVAMPLLFAALGAGVFLRVVSAGIGMLPKVAALAFMLVGALLCCSRCCHCSLFGWAGWA